MIWLHKPIRIRSTVCMYVSVGDLIENMGIHGCKENKSLYGGVSHG